jgi:curved DNA-binding protein CbpA
LPPNYEEDLVAMDFQSKAPDWVVFFYDNAQFKTFDYIVRIYFAEIQITPETVKETHYDESKEIQEGYDYLKDPKGNVMKDSLGNDIKIPKNIIISAHITESQQNKASKVMGEVEIRDGFSNKLVDKVAVSGGAIFSNFFAAYTGNKAALRPETLAKIGNRPVNFPTDMQMVDKSKDEMKNSIYRAIYDRMEIFTK